ncbi:transcription factor bHLH106 [Eucalyptus grandis]|uniref:Uncharacterized protein n=2 Tax=Eucalyptus grandis TaxID=71139 RepID=A0ACC3M6K6_EUCGR|nr:transcription factor bHLH106 [Eucalyptus grandis]KAK3446546.1 hypothetical protein EUGRSUZ_A02230 [Eucalyptus grandis]
MQPESSPEGPSLYQLLAGAGLINVGSYGGGFPVSCEQHQLLPPGGLLQQSFCSSSSNFSYGPFDASANFLSDSGAPEDRTIAALKNHKEAEKRRRARINSHLDKLRSLLPCNSKTDKATLLAMVVQRVRELKQQASDITALDMFPSESDEISVLSSDCSSDGKLIFKASLCCEDRSDLLPDLIEILKSLHLKVQKAEMATLGGRVRNVLVVAADKDHSVESIHFLQNALKSLLERSSSAERSKRRRVLDRKIIMS